MQLEGNTLLEQARANRATAETTLLAMRRSHVRNGQDGELEACFSDAHGVADVAVAILVGQECEFSDIGDDSAQDSGSFGILGEPIDKCKDQARDTGVEVEAYEDWRGCGHWCSGRAIGGCGSP